MCSLFFYDGLPPDDKGIKIVVPSSLGQVVACGKVA